MRKYKLLVLAALISSTAMAQKKPLDHSVYDGWESIQENQLTNNGN